VFEQAGLLFENEHVVARGLVTDSLFARERLASTGPGPRRGHPARAHQGVRRTRWPLWSGCSSRSPSRPLTTNRCSLLIFLLVPEAATQRHLEILSRDRGMLSDRTLRERLEAEPDAAVLHDLRSELAAPAVGRLRARASKPTSISAEALFEAHREALRWESVAGPCPPGAPLRR
jgi:PTS system nitrogen regulatory IIA component